MRKREKKTVSWCPLTLNLVRFSRIWSRVLFCHAGLGVEITFTWSARRKPNLEIFADVELWGSELAGVWGKEQAGEKMLPNQVSYKTWFGGNFWMAHHEPGMCKFGWFSSQCKLYNSISNMKPWSPLTGSTHSVSFLDHKSMKNKHCNLPENS